MTIVSKVEAYKAIDGSLHNNPAQAIAVNLAKLPGRGGPGVITVQAAWAIIKHHDIITDMLSQLDSHTDYDNYRPPATTRD